MGRNMIAFYILSGVISLFLIFKFIQQMSRKPSEIQSKTKLIEIKISSTLLVYGICILRLIYCFLFLQTNTDHILLIAMKAVYLEGDLSH